MKTKVTEYAANSVAVQFTTNATIYPNSFSVNNNTARYTANFYGSIFQCLALKSI